MSATNQRSLSASRGIRRRISGAAVKKISAKPSCRASRSQSSRISASTAQIATSSSEA